MAANHSIAIDLFFHLIVVTLDRRSPLITEILGTEDLGFLKPSFSGRHRGNLDTDSTLVRISASFLEISNLHLRKQKCFV
ncbi:hypothetical protein Q5692_34705 [Microcoleus sp. C2C3]|uniref:hypothetical protein n=1 Tax=unclassified Microcoleus TaxID=2642155 RepID=UPI002FCFA96E